MRNNNKYYTLQLNIDAVGCDVKKCPINECTEPNTVQLGSFEF